MNKIVDKRCLTVEVSDIHIEEVRTNLTDELIGELIKSVARIVKEYKVVVSLDSIENRGVEILQDLLEAVESGAVKERANNDGIVRMSYRDRVIKFEKRPTCLDQIVAKNKKNLGNMTVQVLQYIKKNYNTDEVKDLYSYYDLSSDMKFCVILPDLIHLLNRITGTCNFRKIVYAMHYNKHFEITTTMKTGSYGRSYISSQFVYLGSVK